MALKLFVHPLSPYVRKVQIALHEKGLPFERVFVVPGVAKDDPVYQEFVMASPRREVPCLVDGDKRIFDSTIILEYLDERWPNPPLLPDSPAERGRVRMLEEMMDTEYEAVNWGLTEILVFHRAEGARAAALTTRAALQLQRLWNRLEREIGGRTWMNGTRFGRGDAAVYPHLAISRGLGHEPGERHPRLGSWLERCAARESIRRDAAEVAHYARSEAKEAPAVRRYRDHRLEWMLKTGGSEIVREGLADGTIRFADEFE